MRKVFYRLACWCESGGVCGWTSMIKFTSTNDINSCRKSFYAVCCESHTHRHSNFRGGFGLPSTYRHVKHCNLWPGMQIISANHMINFSLLCICWYEIVVLPSPYTVHMFITKVLLLWFLFFNFFVFVLYFCVIISMWFISSFNDFSYLNALISRSEQ